MISDTPFTRSEESRRNEVGWRIAAPLGILMLAAGCAHDALDDAAWQASRVGTAVGDHHEMTQISGLEAGSRIVEKFYYVAKYQATGEQRRVAATAGRTLEKRIVTQPRRGRGSAPASQSARKTRYLAVRTQSDARAKTKTSVMIWDTYAEQIVGNNVYDLNSAPPTGTLVKFDTYAAEYVAAE